MRGKAAHKFDWRVVLCLCRVAALYNEPDAVAVKCLEDGQDFQCVKAYEVEICHYNGVYLVMLR